jgi:hypothetical protein
MDGIVDALSPEERQLWNNFRLCREAEINVLLQKDGSSSLLTSVLWFEFLKYRWAVKCKVPFPDCDPIIYAHRTRVFGPDLGAWRPLAPAVTALRRRKKDKKKSKNPSVHRSLSTYQYFVSVRHAEFRKTPHPFSPSDLTKQVAKEWNEMTAEQRVHWDQKRIDFERESQRGEGITP